MNNKKEEDYRFLFLIFQINFNNKRKLTKIIPSYNNTWQNWHHCRIVNESNPVIKMN